MVSYGLSVFTAGMKPVGLNPYCSGRWSRTIRPYDDYKAWDVLILIVVEDGLVQPRNDCRQFCHNVLILIVVEDGLVPRQKQIYSQTLKTVLILIVVEDGLVLNLKII